VRGSPYLSKMGRLRADWCCRWTHFNY